MLRILTAVVLLVLFWTIIKIAPDWVFFSVAGVVIVIATWESLRLADAREARPLKIVALAATVGVIVSFTRAEPWMSLVVSLTAACLVTVVGSMALRDAPLAMMRSTVSTIFPVMFVGVGLGFALGLKTFPGEEGEDLLMLLLVCATALDTVAYYVGRAVGRHRMAPVLSPNKTWEGAAGGILACIGAAVLAHLWFYQRLPLVHALALGGIIAVAGILGDLAESMVKRAAGAKDASALLPGHGGVLDRIDSLLLAGPVLYYYYLVFLRGAV
ncbi:MAG: phosphatidate cytidylyltransferase [Acidobacteriota bacterium]|nr:phosphatidate cytidylyltransferase [Acidobacteriota bacterium]